MDANDKITSEKEAEPPQTEEIGGNEGYGGWSGGGWGFSPFSYLSDLQKAAAVAAEEISRNAASVAQTAAKSIADMQNVDDDDTEGAGGGSDTDREDRNEKENLRRSALDKLENVGEDTYLSQGLQMVDTSVESFALGAWKALGSAWKGGSAFIQKIEHSAVNMADSIQQEDTTDSGGPSLFETGKALTFKGLQVLENVGKETMDLLISETGIEVDNRSVGTDHQDNEDQMYEEVSFDRCFYIYGGPEQLEELEALSSHYTLLFNRRKAKLSSDQKSFYEGKVKQVQKILDLNMEADAIVVESDKGKKVETGADGSDSELKSLCDSGVSKAADMAAGFTSALAGLAANDIVQRTTGRLESIHSEGVHRLSEVCCFAVSQLMMLAKSVISSANKNESEKADDDNVKIEWPEDSVEKANIIRSKAKSMTDGLEAVSNSFITGISDVGEAYIAAIKTTTATDSHKIPEKSIQDKANAFKEHLHADQTNAIGKIQDGLQYLCFVVVSTSIPSA